jgi:hypothetical protein
MRLQNLTENRSVGAGLLAGVLCFALAASKIWLAIGSPTHREPRLVSAILWIVIGTVILLQQRRRYKTSQRAARIDRGLCPYCAYDLRENSDRCPECGRPVPYGILLGRKITLKRKNLHASSRSMERMP